LLFLARNRTMAFPKYSWNSLKRTLKAARLHAGPMSLAANQGIGINTRLAPGIIEKIRNALQVIDFLPLSTAHSFSYTLP
jgi:hypothetical protein